VRRKHRIANIVIGSAVLDKDPAENEILRLGLCNNAGYGCADTGKLPMGTAAIRVGGPIPQSQRLGTGFVELSPEAESMPMYNQNKVKNNAVRDVHKGPTTQCC
jgi:hypothetical protein